jgi:hypothetical protein
VSHDSPSAAILLSLAFLFPPFQCNPKQQSPIILIYYTREFNELVNMSASELESWLKEEDSTSSGWSKDDGSGETVGHDRYVYFHWH